MCKFAQQLQSNFNQIQFYIAMYSLTGMHLPMQTPNLTHAYASNHFLYTCIYKDFERKPSLEMIILHNLVANVCKYCDKILKRACSCIYRCCKLPIVHCLKGCTSLVHIIQEIYIIKELHHSG